MRLFSLVPLSFGNRTQNSRVAGARPNHQPIGGSDPNHQGIWSPPRAWLSFFCTRYRCVYCSTETDTESVVLPTTDTCAEIRGEWRELEGNQNGAASAVYGQDLLHRRGICRGSDDGHGARCRPAFRKISVLHCAAPALGVACSAAWSPPPLPLAADSPAPQSCAVSFTFRGQMALKSGLHVTVVDLNKEVSASARPCPCSPLRTINLKTVDPKPPTPSICSRRGVHTPACRCKH